MTSDNVGMPKGSSGRGLRVALIVSLALNVLIIGAVGGTLLFRHGGPGGKGHGHRSLLLGFVHQLPEARQQTLLEPLKARREALEPLRKAEHEARDAARRLLIEEPFDEAKLKSALQLVVAADTSERTAKMTIFAETAAKLTPEERKELYKWIKRHRPYHRRRRR